MSGTATRQAPTRRPGWRAWPAEGRDYRVAGRLDPALQERPVRPLPVQGVAPAPAARPHPDPLHRPGGPPPWPPPRRAPDARAVPALARLGQRSPARRLPVRRRQRRVRRPARPCAHWLAQDQRDWLDTIAQVFRTGVAEGHFRPDADPAQLGPTTCTGPAGLPPRQPAARRPRRRRPRHPRLRGAGGGRPPRLVLAD